MIKYICPWRNTALGCANVVPCRNCVEVKAIDLSEEPMYSVEYLEWAKETEQKGLTRTEHEFAEWLLKNKDEIAKIGNLEPIFVSVYKWLKFGNDSKKEEFVFKKMKNDIYNRAGKD